jgi:hypothetical protein
VSAELGVAVARDEAQKLAARQGGLSHSEQATAAATVDLVLPMERDQRSRGDRPGGGLRALLPFHSDSAACRYRHKRNARPMQQHAG